MDIDKDEALRCMRIAEEAISIGNKERALKFIKISHRLNPNLPVCQLLDACENFDSASPRMFIGKEHDNMADNRPCSAKCQESLNGDRSYSEEHAQLIRQVRVSLDYYAILGVEKTSSITDIKKAYRKLLLKVHPDKNKAPGSREAFEKVSKAFKCLSNSDLRTLYDNAQCNMKVRSMTGDLFDDHSQPNETFQAFRGHGDLSEESYSYGRRGSSGSRRKEGSDATGFNFMVILQILPFWIILLLAYLPFTGCEYSMFKNQPYHIPKITERHRVEFFVKSLDFDVRYPPGSGARANFEEDVIKDYKNMLWRFCRIETRRRRWNKDLPTPNCNKLQNLSVP
ncbi:hypothetical protein SAY87_000661 [Trapa incisa]|uniref:J domain-containing protein n=1 Tax=Trapa incisa TaxID=236973 RepID=A0AAN7JH55_9MYRT|nr:hypothetical protein SAY87_000661 [Trapa incisa]